MNLRLLLAGVLWLCLASCGAVPAKPNLTHIHILYPAGSPRAIQLAATDLKQDLAVVPGAAVTVGPQPASAADLTIIIGLREPLAIQPLLNEHSRSVLQQIVGARGGVMHLQPGTTPVIILAGADVQGTQYSVYDFSQQFLGADPLAYWTGSKAAPVPFSSLLTLTTQQIAPPVVPLLVYFENDVDELANFRGTSLQYDWQSFTAMIDSLVRLRYNGIELFDMLGRIEFYRRPEYTARYPDYQLDTAYLQRMIDYIHDKGMLLQIDMMMGRQLGSLPEEAANCWSSHKDEWLNTWRYYLQHTPIKHADIFALRPRHQIWDWAYQSSCGEDKAEVFNQVYAALGQLIGQYKPGATKVCTCYHDGMALFNGNFNPPKDFIVAWSDDGWGDFAELPLSSKGHAMGTYMHAGFWLNHDVADPYPQRIEEVMRRMYQQHQADRYMMVNGQTFRPFLLNIEAYAESARLGNAFDGEQFYRQWLSRYFGDAAAPHAQQALQQLHQAHDGHTGYVEILWQIKVLHGFLANQPVQQPGRHHFEVTAAHILPWLDATQPRIQALQLGQQYAIQGQKLLQRNNVFYYDHIQLPLQLYLDLLQYNQLLLQLAQLKIQAPAEWFQELGQGLLQQAQQQLTTLYQRRLQGDEDPRWAGWYHPDNRRPNNGFPAEADLAAIAKAMQQASSK